jgi:excisionase family DNA binding protein
MHCYQECYQRAVLHIVTGREQRPGRRGRGPRQRTAPHRRASALTLFTIEQFRAIFEEYIAGDIERGCRRLSLTKFTDSEQLRALVQQRENTNPPGEVRTGAIKGRNSGSGTETRCSALQGVAVGPCRWRFHLNHETTVSNDPVTAAPSLLTLNDAAQRLAVCRRTLERLIARGEFPLPVKVGGASRILVSDLHAYLQRVTEQRGAA